jgi:hypothetical protein
MTLRDLPQGCILPVSGVSFRQDNVQSVLEGQLVHLDHQWSHPNSRYAVTVRTAEGALLGYVPEKSGLAERLAGLHPGGSWEGRIHEVLHGETIGLRVSLGKLTGVRERTPGSDYAGERGPCEGGSLDCVTDNDLVIPNENEKAPAGYVTTLTGRNLGTFLSEEGDLVRVQHGERISAWPKSTVTVTLSSESNELNALC